MALPTPLCTTRTRRALPPCLIFILIHYISMCVGYKNHSPAKPKDSHEKTTPPPPRPLRPAHCTLCRAGRRCRAHQHAGAAHCRFGSSIAVLERNQSARNGNVREVIIEHRSGRNPAYVCSITPFRKTYEATSHNEGLARTQVRRTCQAEQNAIFCEDSDIKCRRYD